MDVASRPTPQGRLPQTWIQYTQHQLYSVADMHETRINIRFLARLCAWRSSYIQQPLQVVCNRGQNGRFSLPWLASLVVCASSALPPATLSCRPADTVRTSQRQRGIVGARGGIPSSEAPISACAQGDKLPNSACQTANSAPSEPQQTATQRFPQCQGLNAGRKSGLESLFGLGAWPGEPRQTRCNPVRTKRGTFV